MKHVVRLIVEFEMLLLHTIVEPSPLFWLLLLLELLLPFQRALHWFNFLHLLIDHLILLLLYLLCLLCLLNLNRLRLLILLILI